ncbi:MAG: mycothiol synthase [Candidatus Nanopelagicales bacterium]
MTPVRVTRLDATQAEAVADLMATEEIRSGRRPLDEARRQALTAGAPGEHWLLVEDGMLRGFADVVDSVAELSAADTQAATLLVRTLRDSGARTLWAHGDRSQARRAATAVGLPVARELVLLARTLPLEGAVRPLPDGVTVRSFDTVGDRDPWLQLNHLAFADLPDQGGWTRDDLDLRLRADWFDADDFLVAVDGDGRLVGFHWTKIDPAAVADGQVSGEVFVLAVAPSERGTGLAGALLDLGLRHLADRGLRQVHLYVDADNVRAVALYERAGFHRVDGDREYRLT